MVIPSQSDWSKKKGNNNITMTTNNALQKQARNESEILVKCRKDRRSNYRTRLKDFQRTKLKDFPANPTENK